MTMDDTTEKSPSRWRKFILVVLAFSLPVAVLLVTFRFWLFQSFNIPSSSGFPNLVTGDYVLVSKSAYRTGDPKRGDIAVFKLPADPGIYYIMRVIGLPGDRVRVKQGILQLDGVAVKREPLELKLPSSYGDVPKDIFYRETLPEGRSYVIAEISDTEQLDNTEEFLVPAGHYFVMGDNRDNSADSRWNVGFVPRENFIGPFYVLFWNSEGYPLTGRPDETPAR
jgi:signal peptidase I